MRTALVIAALAAVAVTNACAADELMVGVNVRSGAGIDAVGPICANASQWDANGSTPTRQLALNGGGGGTLAMNWL